MSAIHLDPNQVPASLRGAYQGKKFKAVVCETVTIPSTAGLWDGGSRDVYQLVALENGKAVEPLNHNAAPWDSSRREQVIRLQPGVAVVEHSTFCGKDMGLTFYVHPDNAAKLLPAPAELSDHEKIVLEATQSFKASYMGRDRYQMALENTRYSSNPEPFPTRGEWDAAKHSLIARGFLNKAGAITNAGRNAIASNLTFPP